MKKPAPKAYSLIQLQASLRRITRIDEDGELAAHAPADTLKEAQGLQFLCPKCFHANGGAEGTHTVLCWFEDRVPPKLMPGPGRWKPQGTAIENLSFVPGKKSHSVLLTGGCAWHGFVTDGKATVKTR